MLQSGQLPAAYHPCCIEVIIATSLPPRPQGDLVDEYVRMSETTCLMSLYKFCKTVVEVFGPEYLRQPTAADTERLLATNAARGFQVCLAA